MQPYFDSNTVATIVAAAAIFFVALIVASYITMKISDFVIDSRVGAIDRALGFVFGAVRGLLLLVVAVWFFDFLVQAAAGLDRQRPDATGPRCLGGDQLIALLPADFETWVKQKISGASGGAPAADERHRRRRAGRRRPPAPEDDAGPPAKTIRRYTAEGQQGIDQLIENNEGGTAQ